MNPLTLGRVGKSWISYGVWRPQSRRPSLMRPGPGPLEAGSRVGHSRLRPSPVASILPRICPHALGECRNGDQVHRRPADRPVAPGLPGTSSARSRLVEDVRALLSVAAAGLLLPGHELSGATRAADPDRPAHPIRGPSRAFRPGTCPCSGGRVLLRLPLLTGRSSCRRRLSTDPDASAPANLIGHPSSWHDGPVARRLSQEKIVIST